MPGGYQADVFGFALRMSDVCRKLEKGLEDDTERAVQKPPIHVKRVSLTGE